METLLAAANRGVDVRLIVPGFSDTNSVVHASRSRYGKLVKHGIRVFETTTTVLHAKAAVIDGIWSTVGSSNLDYRSFLHNDEVNAVIFGVEFASQMEAQFRKDLENTSEVTLESWKRRPLGDRFKEFFSWAVEYWL
jgi:cardiolipin synthase